MLSDSQQGASPIDPSHLDDSPLFACQPAERWLPVVGYEKYYEVSDQGRIRRSVDSFTRGIKAGYVLKPIVNHKGYPFVGLHNRETKVSKSLLLHNVVTAAFLGPKPKGIQVNHIDGVKTNAFLSNLEYSTSSHNQRHAYLTGLNKKSLTPSLVREIRLWQGKLSSRAVGAVFGVAPQSVQMVWRRIAWESLPDYDPVDYQNF